MSADSRRLVSQSGLPEHEAVRLLIAVSDLDRVAVVLGAQVSETESVAFDALVERRRSGEPLQYLEGDIPFGPVVVSVDRRALIPRPETEELFELAVSLQVDAPHRILDVCTGSGNLAVALASTYPDAEVAATDSSAEALSLARHNAERNGVSVDFRLGDLFSPLDQRQRRTFDLVVCNPPYLSEEEYSVVPPELVWEPKQALVSGPAGDEVILRIAESASDWLAPRGLLVVEIGADQASRASELFADYDHRVGSDLAGRNRFVIARRKVE